MGSSALLKQLKGLVHDFYVEDKVLMEPVGRLSKKELPEDTIKFLSQFVDLLMNTRITCTETKLYISDLYITHRGIANEMELKGLGRPNTNTIQTKIWNDKAKIIKLFGEGMLLELIEYRNTSNLSHYNSQLSKAKEKYSNSRLLSNIALKLPDTTNIKTTSVDSSEFDEFISIIRPYCKRHMSFISEQLPVEVVSYCKYILESKDVSDIDRDNRDKLLEIIAE